MRWAMVFRAVVSKVFGVLVLGTQVPQLFLVQAMVFESHAHIKCVYGINGQRCHPGVLVLDHRCLAHRVFGNGRLCHLCLCRVFDVLGVDALVIDALVLRAVEFGVFRSGVVVREDVCSYGDWPADGL